MGLSTQTVTLMGANKAAIVAVDDSGSLKIVHVNIDSSGAEKGPLATRCCQCSQPATPDQVPANIKLTSRPYATGIVAALSSTGLFTQTAIATAFHRGAVL